MYFPLVYKKQEDPLFKAIFTLFKFEIYAEEGMHCVHDYYNEFLIRNSFFNMTIIVLYNRNSDLSKDMILHFNSKQSNKSIFSFISIEYDPHIKKINKEEGRRKKKITIL